MDTATAHRTSWVRTFLVPDGFEMPSVDRIARPPGETSGRRRVLATYWDTVDLRLTRAGAALSWSDDRWELATRSPVMVAVDGDRHATPAPLAPVLAAFAGSRPLRPALTLDVDRRPAATAAPVPAARAGGTGAPGRSEVAIDDDRVVAEVLSSGEVLTWRSVRVSTTAPGTALAGDLVKALRRAGAAPRAVTAPVADDESPAPAGDPIASRLRELLSTFGESALDLWLDAPDGVHDLRVTVRRLRSCLRTFRPVLDRAVSEPLRQELGWVAELLGQARDAEVLASRFARGLDALEVEERLGPVRDDLVGTRRSAAGAARVTVIEALDTDRFRALVDRLVALADGPPYRGGARPGRRELRRCVRKEVRRVRRRVRGAEAQPPGPQRDAAFHEVRKAVKRVRYAAETLSPVAPEAAHRVARRFEEIQKVLGDRQDAAVARRALTEAGARAGVRSGHNGFTYGVLAEGERRAVLAAEGEWRTTWPRASTKALRRLVRR